MRVEYNVEADEEIWTAESPADLEGWEILQWESIRPGLWCLHCRRQDTPEQFQLIYAHPAIAPQPTSPELVR